MLVRESGHLDKVEVKDIVTRRNELTRMRITPHRDDYLLDSHSLMAVTVDLCCSHYYSLLFPLTVDN